MPLTNQEQEQPLENDSDSTGKYDDMLMLRQSLIECESNCRTVGKHAEASMYRVFLKQLGGIESRLTALEMVERERDELEERASTAEFFRAHSEQQNREFEQDYLAIWKAVKTPDQTILESVLALKARLTASESIRQELAEAVAEVLAYKIPVHDLICSEEFFAGLRKALARHRNGSNESGGKGERV
jgi:hypothetical protein